MLPTPMELFTRLMLAFNQSDFDPFNVFIPV